MTGCHLTAPKVMIYALSIRLNHWKKKAKALRASKTCWEKMVGMQHNYRTAWAAGWMPSCWLLSHFCR